MSAKAPPTNKRRPAKGASVVEAPADPLLLGDDSPLPPSATTTTSVRPPPAPSPARARVSAMAKLVAGAALVISTSVGVAWGARRYLLSTPRFAIRTVLVEGQSRRSAADIAKEGGIAIGQNIFALDLDRARASLAADPWIESATITRTLPSTLHVKVVERDARAVASIAGQLYLVTRDGEPFKKVSGDDPADLPVITGISEDQVARDRPGVVLAMKRLLDVAADLDKAGITKRYPLQELHLEKDDTLVVTLGREAIALQLGHAPYRGKIEQAARVLDEVARRKADASVLFLDNDAHPERVVVRMR